MIRLAALLLLSAGAVADAPAPLFTNAFTVPARHRLVEGVASDGRGRVWVSSVLDRVIVARTGGRSRTLRMPASTLHPMGIAWDAGRGWLWIATDCPDLPGIAKCDSGALVAIDAAGRLRASLFPGGPFHPGDVSVGGGDVFVSDSANGAVYRLPPAGKTLETLIPAGIGKSAQGSALDPSGARLIVADYAAGIAAVDLATGRRTLLPMPDGKPLRGIDGLVRAGDRYFAIFNGRSPGALMALGVGDDGITAGVVHRGPPLADPTQIAVAGDRLLIVADAGWEGAARPVPARRAAAPVVAFPLPR